MVFHKINTIEFSFHCIPFHWSSADMFKLCWIFFWVLCLIITAWIGLLWLLCAWTYLCVAKRTYYFVSRMAFFLHWSTIALKVQYSVRRVVIKCGWVVLFERRDYDDNAEWVVSIFLKAEFITLLYELNLLYFCKYLALDILIWAEFFFYLVEILHFNIYGLIQNPTKL